MSHHPDLGRIIDQIIAWSGGCLLNRGLPSAIVLAGESGCGKTHITRLISNNFRNPGGPIEFVEEPALLAELRASYSNKHQDSEKIIRRCQQANLLIYDDLGTGHIGNEAWLDDIYWRLFNGRHEAGKATLITTNLDQLNFALRVESRGWSRVQEAIGSPENFISMFHIPDYRARAWDEK